MTSRFAATLGLFFSLLMMSFTPALAGAKEAGDFVSRMGSQALEIVQSKAGSKAEHQAQLEQLFISNVDIDWIAKFVLGKYSRQATPSQMSRYTQEYRAFLVKHYTGRFAEYSGETFNVGTVRDDGNGEYTVSLTIVRPNQQNVMTDYRLREQDGSFKVFDIIVEGISLITTQRSDFTSVVSRRGIDYLIEQLARKAVAAPGFESSDDDNS